MFLSGIIGTEIAYNLSDVKDKKEEIINKVKKIDDECRQNEKVYIYKYDDKLIITKAKVYQYKKDAVHHGIKNKQLFIYDMMNKKRCYLTQSVYILYKYNKIKNDIRFIQEYETIKDMEKELQTSYNTLKSYMINSIDAPIKELLKDKYLIIREEVLIQDLRD